MLTSSIKFNNFKNAKQSKLVKKNLNSILSEKSEVLGSLSKSYRNSYKNKIVNFFRKKLDYRIIGMGGSILGSQAIYGFLKKKIKKNFYFVDNLQVSNPKKIKKNYNNLIISKSGNTIETIANLNFLVKNGDKNLILTENKKNSLRKIANQLKAEVVDHNNYIGGRYSVLSEVGMLPAELMGLKSSNFRQLNSLILNKNFLNSLIANVNSILFYIKQKKYYSVIINYDEKSEGLFKWYQQLVAESLGKKKTGILPLISNMPKDNHSLMQLYLDGFKKNFYTFFYVHDSNSKKINNDKLLADQKFLKNKSISEIIYSQKKASEKVFKMKNIPFRSFEINKRSENSLGELFSFFILETILIGKCLNLNPYNQPAVELIKIETKKNLI
jgi:glucose-6-phosphate isomerase